ncbi:MAG: D-tyrosyl-tRNA(Tyr) deacylase [Myxococcales bacterium]|nr:D-tyrosyl-tRNA(Tyr) deacylase [Myxococcales bacterium]
MRAVVQRVSRGQVSVANECTGAIGRGLVVLLSVGKDDTDADLPVMVSKISGLRVFTDSAGKMNLNVQQVGGSVLLISQFTLHGDVRKGKRPSFMAAMAPEPARAAVERVATALRAEGIVVEEGVFGADMQVELVNDGPVTILIDTKRNF